LSFATILVNASIQDDLEKNQTHQTFSFVRVIFLIWSWLELHFGLVLSNLKWFQQIAQEL